MISSQHCAPPRARLSGAAQSLRIALAGPPNVGKSTIFNRLTGLSQHVGNWTGKTVELATGEYTRGETVVGVVDLPGAYSLSATSMEEEIARDALVTDRPDAVVVVVSAPHLERTLYLVAEIAAIGLPMVVALNMVDVARSEGIDVDARALAAVLGCPVVPLVASTGAGIERLMDEVLELAGSPRSGGAGPSVLTGDLAALHGRLVAALDGIDVAPYPVNWLALKLLEGDQKLTTFVKRRLGEQANAAVDLVLGLAEDAPIRIASARYEWIARIVAESQRVPATPRVSATARIDRVAANLYVGPLLLTALMGVVFWVVFKLSTPIVDGFNAVLTLASDEITAVIGPWSPLIADFLTSGIIGGVGTMLSLVPVIAVFYLAMGILEDVGYMARAAYVVDSLMHRIGLHGKSFLPLFLGFGCNVPAVLGARILESQRSRVLTILLTPFVPCSARLVVVMFISGAIFGDLAPLVTGALVGLGIAMLVLTGLLASRLLYKSENPPFVMEMPLYHAPNWRGIAIVTWHHVLAFVKRAGTVILEVSVVVWALSTFPGKSMDESFLAWIGRALEPVGQLMGQDWRMIVALLTSFVAKENALATMSVLTAQESDSLAAALPTIFSPAAAAAFLVAQVLFVPCVATVATLKQETGSWKLTALSLGYHTVLSFVAAVVTFQTLTALGLGR